MKLAIAVMALAGLIAFPAQTAYLTIELRTRASGGSIAVAVYRDAEAFRRGEGPVATRTVPRSGPATLVTFEGLGPGRYAVAAFHDTDGNGDLTLWPFGLPKEAYGFSRDARGQFGPPAFSAAAFEVPTTGARQTLSLR